MKEATVKILGKEFELFWSAQAMDEVSALCGKLSKMQDWIMGDDKEDVAGIYKRFTQVLEILINAAIKRDNYAIIHGFKQGEQIKMFEAGDLSVIIGYGELADIIAVMYSALSRDTNYEVPDDVKIEKKEVDETLDEIREARRKKTESGE